MINSGQIRSGMRDSILVITGLLQELDSSNIEGEINLHMTDRGVGDEGAQLTAWLHIGGAIRNEQRSGPLVTVNVEGPVNSMVLPETWEYQSTTAYTIPEMNELGAQGWEIYQIDTSYKPAIIQMKRKAR